MEGGGAGVLVLVLVLVALALALVLLKLLVLACTCKTAVLVRDLPGSKCKASSRALPLLLDVGMLLGTVGAP